jgi:cystathionine beta-lyase
MTKSSTVPQAPSTYHPQTELLHPPTPVTPGFVSFVPPVTRGSTVLFPDLASMRSLDWRDDNRWRYGLHATPVSAELTQRLAALEGGQHALLQPSGLAAISNVYFGIVKTGDDVLLPDNAYGPTAEHARWLAEDFGVGVRFYDPLAGAAIAELIQPNTKLIWLEAPGSVTMEIPDVPAITRVARDKGIVTAIDNTWSAGLAFRPFDHGCDISVQALTKYQSGGSDVLMGATITADRDLHLRLKRARMHMGLGVSADDCALVLRGLPSMAVRFAAHDRSALALAHWLKSRPEVSAVLHPALPDCGGHALWKRDFTGSGGLFSIVLDEAFTPAQVDAFVEGLRLFSMGWSWGGAQSLAMPYDVRAMRSVSGWPHRGVLVRLYIGLEDERDLREDLAASLAANLSR